MPCIICSFPMHYFFSKQIKGYNLTNPFDYWKCENCGFVISKTHAELSRSDWEKINHLYHSSYQGKDLNPDDLGWIERLQSQAAVLSDLIHIGLLDAADKWLDFACGDGKLSSILKESYDLILLNYDRYMPARKGFLTDNELREKAFDLVITTSVFEHLTKREDYDFIESLVSDDGILGLHTVVCENVPCDPSWFYLLPVHCAFHTNRSMSILFQQWGYKASIYNVDARLWLWFKTNCRKVRAIVNRANVRPKGPEYIYKDGFVDYWK